MPRIVITMLDTTEQHNSRTAEQVFTQCPNRAINSNSRPKDRQLSPYLDGLMGSRACSSSLTKHRHLQLRC
jgi:hypothetical protein